MTPVIWVGYPFREGPMVANVFLGSKGAPANGRTSSISARIALYRSLDADGRIPEEKRV